MKKYNTSKLTIITALILTASLFLSGCSESDVEAVGGSDNNDTVTETNVTEAEETTPAVTVTEETAEPVTSAAESAATTAADTEQTTEAPASTPVNTAAPVAAWTETAASGTMYINTNGIYSRKEAVQGSTKVKQYRLNEAVTVTAKTDTNYYKLSDGTFIHADYLSSNKLTATTTTVAIKPVVTTSYAQQSNPTEQDRSYLNLSKSDVQYILNECQKYAKSLGYTVMTYSEYQKKVDELDKAFYELKDTDEGYQKYVDMCREFDSTLKCIANVPVEEFWSGNWHNIMYAGNFKKTEERTYGLDGYDTHCSTKAESMDWVIRYLKQQIDEERKEGRSISVTGTNLRIFDNYGKENDGVWGMVKYETIHREYSSYDVYDLDTSYAFSVKFY